MTIYGIWNAINDPLAGQWSDRTRTRWGRRIPFILFGTVPFCIIFVLVWTVPQSVQASANSLFAYFLAMAFLFDGLFTVVILNWTALFPEMYPSLRERSSVSATKQALGIVGMIVGMALAPAVRDRRMDRNGHHLRRSGPRGHVPEPAWIRTAGFSEKWACQSPKHSSIHS